LPPDRRGLYYEPTKPTVQVGLIGCGTVGLGVLKILQKNLALIEQRIGAEVRVRWVCDKVRVSLPPDLSPAPRVTDDWRAVVSDPEVDVVVELIGGYEPARTIVLAALNAGKHVATANKALLAKYWGEVFTTAAQASALVYFEAAVGGGIPVVQGLNEGLAANRIERIYGILNGTTNYILTRMTSERLDFATALGAAQAAGFAEADPSFDIDGVDAAHKIAILASLATGGWVHLDGVHREGIASLDVWDVLFARNHLGMTVKMLGIADLDGASVCARVYPALVPSSHPFANVAMEYNAIFVHGDAVGDVMFYGKGAGQLAAASAVVSDVMFLARHVANGTAGKAPYVAYQPSRTLAVAPLEGTRRKHYLRFTTADEPGVLAKVTRILSDQGISIASLVQDSAQPLAAGVPIVVVTHEATEGSIRAAIAQIDPLEFVVAKTVHLRIEELGR
jgi:homoserine dehydrogenase